MKYKIPSLQLYEEESDTINTVYAVCEKLNNLHFQPDTKVIIVSSLI